MHFQDKDAYGRIVHLQPMRWKDGWPVMGDDPDGDGKGEPVAGGAKPSVRGPVERAVPATSDTFDGAALGLQWQWQANPDPSWALLHAGALRLRALATPGATLWTAPNLLLQKWPAPAFTARTRIDPAGLRTGEAAGLLVFGLDYATLAVERTDRGLTLRRATCAGADKGAPETVEASVPIEGGPIDLAVTIAEGAWCRFAYSRGDAPRPIGAEFRARPGLWVGAKVGLFARGSGQGHADFEWFRVE